MNHPHFERERVRRSLSLTLLHSPGLWRHLLLQRMSRFRVTSCQNTQLSGCAKWVSRNRSKGKCTFRVGKECFALGKSRLQLILGNDAQHDWRSVGSQDANDDGCSANYCRSDDEKCIWPVRQIIKNSYSSPGRCFACLISSLDMWEASAEACFCCRNRALLALDATEVDLFFWFGSDETRLSCLPID